MNELKFSVSMCVYGGDNAKDFDEALESVFNQTLIPNQVVLVVDGPIPNDIDQVINNYENQYDFFEVYRLKENQGHGNARRFGFSKCNYDYVAIADADDINVKDRFEIQMDYFKKNPTLSAISSGCYHFVNSIDNVLNEEILPQTDSEIKSFLKKRCPLCQPSVILRKEDVDKAGGYLDWYHAEDYYLWIRMFLNGATFANSEKSLVYMRTDPDQVNRRGGYKYYKSMQTLFKYMFNNDVIDYKTYLFNVSSRFVMQVLMPSKLRAFVRKKML